MTEPYQLFAEARQQGPNPFRLETVISDREVWGEVLTDLPNLNRDIDDKIYQAISEVRQQDSHKIGIAIEGDRGTGKSHAIHRLWKNIEGEGGAVFAYIPPTINPRFINSHVRFYLCESFKHQDRHGASQWQKLSTAVLATLKGTEFEQEYQEYLELVEGPENLKKYIKKKIAKDNLLNWMMDLVDCIVEIKPELDPDFVKAVLFLLFKNDRFATAALAWIKGEDHPNIKDLLGLPEYSTEVQDERSIWMMEQICKVAEVAALPVLICFDQLDSAEPDIETGDSPAQTVARCIDRIYMQCSNLIVICCVISDTWREIKQMGSGIPDRVGQRSVMAKPPTDEQMIEIVQSRLNWFYQKHNLQVQDYPDLYPLESSKIRNIAREGAGVRSVLEECAKIFDSVGVDSQSLVRNEGDNIPKKFRDIYHDILERVNDTMKDDYHLADDNLAAIIAQNIRMLPEGGTAFVVVDRVEEVNSSSHDIQFTISGYDQFRQKQVKIGVKVCETENGHTFNAVMKRLLDYEKHQITRSCLLRYHEVPKKWKKGKQLEQELVAEKGGKVVLWEREGILPLVALKRIYDEAEEHGFAKEEVSNLVKELKLEVDNQLIHQILRDG